MSALSRPSAAERNQLLVYRDDGPISGLLAGSVPGRVPPLAPVLVVAALTLVLSLTGLVGDGPLALLVPVVALLLVGPAATDPHRGRLDWLVPPLIRAIEYGYLAVLGFTHDVSKPLVYVLIAVLAYHHYDTVYRTRQKLWPQDWVFRAGFGWEGRMLVAAVAALVGVLPFAYAALAAYLGVLFVVESVLTWTRTDRGNGVMVNLEEEEEAQ